MLAAVLSKSSNFNLTDLLRSSTFNLTQIMVALGFSLIASVAVYIIYHLFYGSRNIGAGVDRCFIVIGPAITALFLGIQSSIPLSLGLLGALSFVRFRTPVKDPAEIRLSAAIDCNINRSSNP
jgi:hypothetical protein